VQELKSEVALDLLEEAICQFQVAAKKKGFAHCCKKTYVKDFTKSFNFFRKHMEEEMKGGGTAELDVHKVSALVVLSILDSCPLYVDSECPNPKKAKVSRLANEIAAYIALKIVVQRYQYRDAAGHGGVGKKRSSGVSPFLPQKIYEHKETVNAFVDMLARFSHKYSDTNHRYRLRVLMMPLAFIVFMIDRHGRYRIDEAQGA